MSTPTLYLFRHGLATLNPNGYGDQIVTAELLPEGLEAVTRLAEFLKTQPYDSGFRSEFKRCQQTASKVTQITGRGFTPDPRLNEFHLESFEQYQTRVESWWRWLEQQSYQHVWVCTHGAVAACLKNLMMKGFFELDDRLDYPSTGELWIIDQGKLEYHDFNQGGLKG